MCDIDNGFLFSYGFKAIREESREDYTTPLTPPRGKSPVNVGSTILWNFKLILSYIPIISTIIGIASLILFRNALERKASSAGFVFRSICDIFYLTPLTFIFDTIANVGRLLSCCRK